MVQGNNIIISRKEGSTWVPVAASKSMSIQVDAEQIEISSPTTGVWRDYLNGRKRWGIDLSFLVASGYYSRIRLIEGVEKIQVRMDSGDGYYLVGYANVATAKITATRGNLAQGSWKLQGCGALELE